MINNPNPIFLKNENKTRPKLFLSFSHSTNSKKITISFKPDNLINCKNTSNFGFVVLKLIFLEGLENLKKSPTYPLPIQGCRKRGGRGGSRSENGGGGSAGAPHYYSPPQIFRPSAIPEVCMLSRRTI